MRIIGRGLLALTALLCAAACRPGPAVVPSERVSAPAAAPSERVPAPTATISHPGATPAAAESAPPNRVGIAGSTRGTVACGAARCTVPRETCVLKEPAGSGGALSWQCLTNDRELDVEQSYACDDASDCADGQACCLGFQTASVAYACSVRSGTRTNCALESCVEGGGAACPAGQVCKAGACLPADARATCNGGRCPTSAPICVWAAGAATCASDTAGSAAGEPSPNQLRMSCAANQDCGTGLRCCTNALGNATSCRVNCDAANNLQLCERDADCPAVDSRRLRCLPSSSEAPGHFPAWVQVCGAR